MIFELTVLGSSSALPTSAKFPTAHVLNVHERFFLIDCGEGTQIQLRKAKLKFSRINHIFISHLHGDHVFGLFGLLSTFNLLGRKYPLSLYGPPELIKIIDFYFGNFVDEHNYKIEFHVISKREPQIIYQDKILDVLAFPLKHRIPTFGYLFKEKQRPLNIRKNAVSKFDLNIKQIIQAKNGEDIIRVDGTQIKNERLTEPPFKPRSYAYCSDTAIYKKNMDVFRHVDLLFHESTFLEKDKQLAKKTGHSTTKQAAQIAFEAKVGKLLIGHFSNRYKGYDEFLPEAQEIFKNTAVAEELKTYSVPLTRIKS